VISLGVTIGLACELLSAVCSPERHGGLEIRYGDADMVFACRADARRQASALCLAEGTLALAERLGAPELSGDYQST